MVVDNTSKPESFQLVLLWRTLCWGLFSNMFRRSVSYFAILVSRSSFLLLFPHIVCLSTRIKPSGQIFLAGSHVVDASIEGKLPCIVRHYYRVSVFMSYIFHMLGSGVTWKCEYYIWGRV